MSITVMEYSNLNNNRSNRGRLLDPITLEELKEGIIILDNWGFNSHTIRKIFINKYMFNLIDIIDNEKYIGIVNRLGGIRHPITQNKLDIEDFKYIIDRISNKPRTKYDTRSYRNRVIGLP